MHTDIVIIGGGLAGLTAGIALGAAGFSVVIIEAQDHATFKDTLFDGRVSAIAQSSKKMFEALGVWQEMSKEAGIINDIRITDNQSPLFIHYDHCQIGNEPMGYIVENRHMRIALLKRLEELQNVTLLAPASYGEIHYGNHFVEVSIHNSSPLRGEVVSPEPWRRRTGGGGSKDHPPPTPSPQGRGILRAKLLVAADGRTSPIRQSIGIKTIDAHYHQHGIVRTIRHEKPHHNTAHERFLPAGPFAILPMGYSKENEPSGHYSSLVWTEKSELTPHYMQMEKTAFEHAIAARVGDFLGQIEWVGARWSYPLALTFAKEYSAKRLCLIGDAAHAIHPIAGQGFNLGLRDIAVLTELLTETHRLGLDIGTGIPLRNYETLRRADNLMMITVTDGLNRLFSNTILPIQLARDLGMGAVEHLPFLKRLFMRHAMGVNDNGPKLLRGENV